MTLLGVQALTHGYGGPPLLDGADLHIEEGDRLCLLGRNGAGKSSLLRIMAGEIRSDEGTVTRARNVRVSYLKQELPDSLEGSLRNVCLTMKAGVEGGGETNAPEARESQRIQETRWGDGSGKSDKLVEAERLLTLFELDPERDASSLSGGEMRRLMLASVLSKKPDILLLDEPTNHLDIDSIIRLEEYLVRNVKTFVFVTHDRAFARKCANRVAELDRGEIYSFSTGYDDFIRRREELLEAEENARREFDRKLAQEEEWLRKGLKARRRRNEGRVRRLEQMREQYRRRREQSGSVDMEIHDGGRSGKKVIEAKKLSFGYTEQELVKDFSTTVLRGDRVGIVGPNGSGKTTLLRLLLGELTPQEGSVRTGSNVRPVYFDQMRSELDPDRSVIENIGDGALTIDLNGRKKHVLGYLQDFLFAPERAKSPVAHLSGGEYNRLLMAKLFARPANLLVLDEPTNDLDMDTLELLEELLLDYRGTLILISHDREFLDNVVTDCFVLDGTGRVVEYAGGYADWREREQLRRKAAPDGRDMSGASPDAKKQSVKSDRQKTRPRKISFKEKRELDELPDRIAELEEEKDRIHRDLSDPDLYKSGSAKNGHGEQRQNGRTKPDPSSMVARLEALEKELEETYERWEFLESLPKK